MKSILTVPLMTLIALFLHITPPSARANPSPLLINPNSTSDTGIGDILSSFLQEFNDLGLEQTESSQSDENIVENLGNLTATFVEDVENLGKNLTAGLREHLQNSINDFLDIVRGAQQSLNHYVREVRDVVKRQALQRANSALNEFERSVTRLQAFIEQLRQKIESEVERGEKTIVNAWREWANNQLEIVSIRSNQNTAILNAARTALSELINRYGNYLESCGDEFITQLQLFEGDVQDTINKYLPLVNSLNQEIHACVESNNDNKSSQQCRRYINAGVQELQTAHADFNQLSKNGAHLILSGYRQRACVVEILRSHDVERIEVEAHIRIIIERGVPSDNDDTDNNTENVTESTNNSSEESDSDSDSESEL